jgi:purine-binding chemotaxis protein CheW
MNRDHTKPLVEQPAALTDYLDALLRDAFPESPPAPEPALVTQSVTVPTPVQAPVDVQVPAEVTPKAPAAVKPVIVEPTAVAEMSVSQEADPSTVLSSNTGGVPEWATSQFQVLIFHVAGLQLAVPLIKLSGITNWPTQINQLPHKPIWFTGVTPYRGANAVVVDTAKLIFPQGRQPDPEHVYGAIVFVGDTHFGLSCDRVAEILTLEPDAVSWRGSRSVRPWLAGTVIKEMCAILDVEQFIAMLNS